jgi:hypothetical protein
MPAHLQQRPGGGSRKPSANGAAAPHAGYVVSFIGRHPKTVRVGAKQTLALVVHGQLWTAGGSASTNTGGGGSGGNSASGDVRSIEISAPLEATVFKKRLEIPVNVGHITSLACCSSCSMPGPLGLPVAVNRDATAFVYSGHMDGKVIEWNAATYSCRRVIDLGSYRVSSLLGIGDRHLWVGFGTGKVTVLDLGGGGETALIPDDADAAAAAANSECPSATAAVQVLKEFMCEHNEPIDALVFGESSLLHDGQLIVGSVSKSGHVQLLDGLLTTDFIGK